MFEFSLSIFSCLIIYFINKYRKKISKKTKLIDNPDKIRKLHKKSTPLLGGTMIFSSFLLINLYLIFFQNFNLSVFIIFVICFCCFLLGLIDDIKKISYKYKFFILSVIFFIFISLEPNLQVNKIYFTTLNKEFYLNHISIPFTILCLLLLTNAINLIDGMDGLCILISIIILAWLQLIFQDTDYLNIVLIISLFYVLYLNLKKNIFLGDSGTLFLGSFIGLNIILKYNFEISNIHYSVENIFIALMLPGIDMLRVFFSRVFIMKQNPFLSDRIHLHHLLIAYGFNKFTILTIFLILILLPILLDFFTSFKSIYIILLFVLFYFLIILKLKKLSPR